MGRIFFVRFERSHYYHHLAVMLSKLWYPTIYDTEDYIYPSLTRATAHCATCNAQAGYSCYLLPHKMDTEPLMNPPQVCHPRGLVCRARTQHTASVGNEERLEKIRLNIHVSPLNTVCPKGRKPPQCVSTVRVHQVETRHQIGPTSEYNSARNGVTMHSFCHMDQDVSIGGLLWREEHKDNRRNRYLLGVRLGQWDCVRIPIRNF